MKYDSHPSVIMRRHDNLSKETYSQSQLGVFARRCTKCNEGKPIRGGSMKNRKFVCAGCLKKENKDDNRVP